MAILSPPTRLPLVAGSQTLARVIISLYSSYKKTYIIDLNLIIHRSSPGFEPGSQGPKVATLSLCYIPLTSIVLLVLMIISHTLVGNHSKLNLVLVLVANDRKIMT